MRSLRPQPDRRRDARREADLERDLWAWNVLAPLSGGYAPWTAGSLAPRALVAVLNEIVFSDRDTILECGGGTSTFFIGRLLKALGRGRLLTIEHSDQWASWLDRHLSHEGLGEHVRIVRAPLETTSVGWNPTSEWYRADALASCLAGTSLDLLVVDGPPAFREDVRHARYPAVPFLDRYLSRNSCVILDNVDRDGEREILLRWERETTFRFERRSDLGIAIGRRLSSSSELAL